MKGRSMSYTNKQIEDCFVRIGLWVAVLIVLATYGAIVFAAFLLPTIVKTIKIGWGRSIVSIVLTYLLPYVIAMLFIYMGFLILGTNHPDLVNGVGYIGLFLWFALTVYLALRRWRDINRPFPRIWKWYSAKMFPSWFWGFRGLKNMSFDELQATF
jgi:hypothetical protein